MLEVRSLQAWYGRTQALFGVSLDIAEGETLALVGANGAGKTTIIRALVGLIRASGTIILEGKSLQTVPAHRRASRHGIAVVHEGRGLFPRMTALENLVIGNREATTEAVDELTHLFPALAGRLDERISNLSGGQQQMVALGRAILRKPRLLLLDEPSLGLAPVVVDEIYRFLGILRGTGLTTLLVEQSVPLARRSADRLALIRTGATQMTVASSDEEGVRRLVSAAFAAEPAVPEAP